MIEHAMVPSYPRSAIVGTVVCPKQRPATPTEAWIELTPATTIALHDLLLIESSTQHLLGTVVEMQLIEERTVASAPPRPGSRGSRTTWAKMLILSSSDGQHRPPEGTTVRRPRAEEVTTLLAEARQIPPELRVPLGVVPLHDGVAPVYGHLQRLVGPIATSVLIAGAAGSLKSTAGALLLLGLQQATHGQVALVLVNTKGGDYLLADVAR